MYIQKKVALVLFAVVSSVLTIGCLQEPMTHTYDGPLLVEFPQASMTVDEGTGSIQLKTQLIGEHQDDAKTITFSVNDTTSTAVEGIHYSLTTDRRYDIPAQSSFGYIELNVPDGPLNTGERVSLILVLEGGAGVQPSENYKTFNLSIQGN